MGLILLGLLNPKNPAYVGVSPHPYLLVACILGVLLGLRSALPLCALIAAIYLRYLDKQLNWQAEETLTTVTHMILPAAIVGLPAALGAISDRWRERRRELELEIEKQQRLLTTLEGLNARLFQDKEVAEARTISQYHTIAQVLEYAQSLETTDLAEISDILIDLSCSQLNEDNAYLYLLERGELVQSSFREADVGTLPLRIKRTELETYPLLNVAIIEKRLVRPSIERERQWREKGVLPGLATPLLTPWGQVLGVLVIQRLQYCNAHSSAFAVFEAIGKWGGMCLSRALRLSAVREATYRDEVTGLFSHRYFSRRLKSEFQLAKNHGLELRMVEISVPQIRMVPPLERFAILRVLADAAERASRPVDTVAVGIEPGSVNTIMLLASREDAKAYIKSVKAQFGAFRSTLNSGDRIHLKIVSRRLRSKHATVTDFLDKEAA